MNDVLNEDKGGFGNLFMQSPDHPEIEDQRHFITEDQIFGGLDRGELANPARGDDELRFPDLITR